MYKCVNCGLGFGVSEETDDKGNPTGQFYAGHWCFGIGHHPTWKGPLRGSIEEAEQDIASCSLAHKTEVAPRTGQEAMKRYPNKHKSSFKSEQECVQYNKAQALKRHRWLRGESV